MVLLLVALGFWSDGSGKREILDWEVADGEGNEAWQRLVQRLWDRGVRPEKGLQAVIRDGNGELGKALALVYGTTVVEQRCIFHKLDNVADKCREELKGKEKKEERKRLLDQARAIYQAESASEARTRLGAFADRWRARTPKTVATLERDFEQTIAYYALEGVARDCIRTTSLLERTKRELRRKFRQVCCFGSPQGARVAIYLQVRRLNACWSKQGWWETSRSIWTSSLSTLSQGYATRFLAMNAVRMCHPCRGSVCTGSHRPPSPTAVPGKIEPSASRMKDIRSASFWLNPSGHRCRPTASPCACYMRARPLTYVWPKLMPT